MRSIQIELLVGVWCSNSSAELVDRVNISETQMPLAVVIRGRLLFLTFFSFQLEWFLYLSHNAVGTTELHMQPFYQTVSQLWCHPFEGCRGQDYIQPHMQKVVYSSWELTWKWVAFPLHWRERNGSTLVPILNMSSRIDSKMFLI